MERKITHYVVKPEHLEHFHRFTGYKEHINTLTPNDRHDAEEIQSLTDAKVLDLWCEPVYEKPRVTGWYNVYKDGHLAGPWTKDQAKEHEYHDGQVPFIGQIFIDQEIE